jgi:two-component system nitrogen regulation response regulator NtrX
MARILVVDDEIGIRELLSEILRDEGHDVILAENAAAARIARESARPDLILLDIWMPDTDGVTLLREWSAGGQSGTPVVMMSGHATIETAVEATKIGAFDFLEKPIALAKLLATVQRALEKAPTVVSGGLSLALFNRAGPLRDLRRQIEQVAAKNRSLLLRTAPGGIVELMARTLHVPGRPWIDLALEINPLTIEMLEEASGGVLYAEELAQLSRLQQKNVAFALDRLEKYGLRLVVGTIHDVNELVVRGWDAVAMQRLTELSLGAPTLADVRDEIPYLAGQLLAQFADSGELPLRRLSTAAQNALRQYRWPGGYAELKSTLKSLALAALGEEIDDTGVANLVRTASAEAHSSTLPADVLDLPLREARETFEKLYFTHQLRELDGNMSRLAEKAGLERTHLYRKLKDLGLR